MTISWGFNLDDSQATGAAGRLTAALGGLDTSIKLTDAESTRLESRLRSMSAVELDAAMASTRLSDAQGALARSMREATGEALTDSQLRAARAVKASEVELSKAKDALRLAARSEEELAAATARETAAARASASGLAVLNSREFEVASASARLRDATAKLDTSLRASAGSTDKLTSEQYERERAVRSARAGLMSAQRSVEEYARAEERASHASRFSTQALDALGMAAKSGGVALAALGVAAGVAALGGVAALTYALGALVTEGAKAEIWAQRYRTSLGTVMKSNSEGAVWFDVVRRQAQNLALDVDVAVSEFQRLNNVGFLPQDALRISAMTADLSALGVRAESVGSILNAMGKIKAQGVLQGDELMMLAEAGINVSYIYEGIATRAGVATSEVKKLQTAGQVKADWALPAIEEAVLAATGVKRAGDAARRMATDTIGGAIDVAKGGWRNWLIDLGAEMAPGLETIAGRISGTMSRLSEDGTIDRLSDSIIGTFDLVVRWADDHWPEIESTVRDAVVGIADAFEMASDAATWIEDNWGTIEPIILGVAGAIGLVVAGVTIAGVTLVAGAWAIVAAVTGVVAGVVWLATTIDEAVGGIWTRLTELAASFVDVGASIVEGLVNGIRNAIGNVIEAAKALGSAVLDTFRAVMDSHSPSRKMFSAGFDAGIGVPMGIDAANDNAKQSSARLGAAVMGGFRVGASAKGGFQAGAFGSVGKPPGAGGGVGEFSAFGSFGQPPSAGNEGSPDLFSAPSRAASPRESGSLTVNFGPGAVVIQGSGSGGGVTPIDVEEAITSAFRRVAAQMGVRAA